MRQQRIITALNAVTATATSPNIPVGQARRIGILIRCANHTAGNGVFTFKASLEDVSITPQTMTALNMVIDNLTNTNAQMPTRIASKTLSANGDALLWLDQTCFVNWLQITCTVTTDGTYSAYLILEEEW
jgi:hypothetical protein